jgi:hypothetical protein
MYHNSQHRSLTTTGQKNTRDTYNRDREKSSGQTHLFNISTIGTIDRTSGKPQVKLSLLLCSMSLKIRPRSKKDDHTLRTTESKNQRAKALRKLKMR